MLNLPTVDDLQWIAMTVKQEAEGEPWIGKLAVAWSIVNRATKRRQSISDVVLSSWQYSAWNTDSPTRKRLDNINPVLWRACYKAACAAAFGLARDPTQGATHYLNVEFTRRIRGGSLPDWLKRMKKTTKIGGHTFYK